MQLHSNNFSHNQTIPAKYTCDGQDVSPHLQWSDFPEGTKSFALSCLDPDAPGGNFVHWLIINIPASVTELTESTAIPAGAVELDNGFGKKSYGGPCPPSGTHCYFFTVHALDTDQLIDIDKNNFAEKVKEHSLAKAELVGRYSRN